MRLLVVLMLILLLPSPLAAHRSSDAFLRLSVTGAEIAGQWDVALRDLEEVVGLDGDGDGAITWGELRERHGEIAGYALGRLDISADGSTCATKPDEQLVDHRDGSAFSVLRFSAVCPRAVNALSVTYDLLFDLDPSHRGLLRVDAGDDAGEDGEVQVAVLAPGNATVTLELDQPRGLRQLLGLAREGVLHIWSGYDHLLFLACLLLPAVLRREGGAWVAVPGLGDALWQVTKIVTAFTIAHSITLALAASGVVDLPSRLVEAAIAASILAAALNNLWPLVTERLWIPTMLFGLVHGLGFASALGDLLPPGSALLWALLGFNLGVEAGQLVVVALLIPFLFGLRRSPLYRPLILHAGSLLIAGLAAVWLFERTAGLGQ